MRKHGWRLMAWVAVTSLGTIVAGCGDDNQGNPDFASNPDIAMNQDMTMPDMAAGPDMTLGQGNGQALVIDIVGTIYSPADAGAETAIPNVHILAAQASFPDKSYPNDFDNVNISATMGTINGCVANWYDNTSTSGHHPHGDDNVGTVTMTGYNTKLMVPGPMGMGTGMNLLGLYGPIPSTVACTIPSGMAAYTCVFAKGSGTTPVDNMPTLAAIFPPVPRDANAGGYPGYNVACGASSAGCCTGTGCAPGATDNCTDTVTDPTTMTVYCIQDLWTRGATTTNSASINVPGMAPYTMFSSTAGANGTCAPTGCLGAGKMNDKTFPDRVTITSIKVGATSISPNTIGLLSLDQLDGMLDTTKDVSITWACSPPMCTTTPCTLPPAGDRCTSTSLFPNHVALAAATSPGSINYADFLTQAAAASTTGKFGTLSCFAPVTKSDYTLTVPAMAIKTLLGTQSGGALELILSRVSLSAWITSPKQLQAAGHGEFAFIHHP